MPLSQTTFAGLQLPEWLAYFLQYKSYFLLFITAALCTAVATPLYIILAVRLGWVDTPGGRKAHERVTPTMGGLVIFATVFAGAVAALQLNNRVGEMLRTSSHMIYGLIACTACMLLLGMVDDRNPIRPKVKLMVQSVVAVAAVSLGFRIGAVTLPFMESVILPVPVGVVLSLVWIIGITNAINLTDGLDGLAAGICFLASAVNAIVAIWLGNYYMAVMMVLLAGSLMGFLRWNFHPAKVFLGDTGSLALGMYLALASLASAQKSHTAVMILAPLFALGYPIFDTLLAVARRMARGQPLFSSDRDHIHHRLLSRGGSPSWATIQIYLAAILLAVLCVAAMTSNHFIVGLGIVGAFAVAYFSARVLGYLEWGGWTARWSGREETRQLHAAAQLARLRIANAKTDQELVDALATIAPEIGCACITFTGLTTERHWGRTNDDTSGQIMEMPMSNGASFRFTFTDGASPSGEQRQIMEELCRQVEQRLSNEHDNTPGVPEP
ncbi:MAG: MraY family glycosyltransferase [Planctomycetota bacterium]